jgi:hypothetical protein
VFLSLLTLNYNDICVLLIKCSPGLVWPLFLILENRIEITAFKGSTTVVRVCVVSEMCVIPWQLCSSKPLFNSGRLCWLHYSGFQASFCCWDRNFKNVFTEPLSSRGHVRHIIVPFGYFLWKYSFMSQVSVMTTPVHLFRTLIQQANQMESWILNRPVWTFLPGLQSYWHSHLHENDRMQHMIFLCTTVPSLFWDLSHQQNWKFSFGNHHSHSWVCLDEWVSHWIQLYSHNNDVIAQWCGFLLHIMSYCSILLHDIYFHSLFIISCANLC